jgi:hypothetical protein
VIKAQYCSLKVLVLLGYTRLESRLLRIKETRLKPRIPVSQSDQYWMKAADSMGEIDLGGHVLIVHFS